MNSQLTVLIPLKVKSYWTKINTIEKGNNLADKIEFIFKGTEKLSERITTVQFYSHVVISRTLVLTGKWEALYDEISQFRKACGEAHLKTILATGELGSLTNIYKASLVAMMPGSDFIKTSTGKETVNATFPVAIVMLRAIRDFFWKTGKKVGFKPAGGIQTAKESLAWFSLVKEELGDEWLTPDLFGIGASSLLLDIEKQIYYYVIGQYPAYCDLPMS
ncbi:deoxyribose-phosphate aldolase-like [Chionomys nivalis]|uniref:deoxyribose-phosphate aldolase-like n=1 Tax=Chionomys nivalis TaxID=269649 RepID=UPI00259132CF|nr:deoxyribose-phosphate aldolase-like [Chionomys nivalis]